MARKPVNPFVRGQKATQKYLSSHAEPENLQARKVTTSIGAFGHALAIPAQAEGAPLARCLSRIPAGPEGQNLIVVVVNACADASQAVIRSNRDSLQAIDAEFELIEPLSEHVALRRHPTGRLVVIDRTEAHPLPARQGVGLARKLGCDFLLGAMEDGALVSPWLHCSDADTRLPEDYFRQASEQARKDASALLYRFRHRPDETTPDTFALSQEYESSLRYYVLGLRYAGSPHAFHSVGSAMAVHAHAYARVRGFPRREAAEDFYLLNKLAKDGSIQTLQGLPVEPSARSSDRVPFGTGAAIQKRQATPDEELRVYHPDLFQYLQIWEASLARCLKQPELTPDLPRVVASQARGTANVDGARLLDALTESEALIRAQRALNGPDATITQALRDNLDAFRTLRLVHALRDRDLGEMALREALQRAPFIKLETDAQNLPIHEIAEQLERLDYRPDSNKTGARARQ